jgi:alkylhydroperoxidase/carboxymuconolactone decarboxylase family protein YurZ
MEREAIRHVALLAISTGGYPAAMAAFGWINEVLDHRPSAPEDR